jgi:hypothetical protein
MAVLVFQLEFLSESAQTIPAISKTKARPEAGEIDATRTTLVKHGLYLAKILSVTVRLLTLNGKSCFFEAFTADLLTLLKAIEI